MPDAPTSSSQGVHAGRRGRATLLLIAAVCLAPIVASYTIYYLYPREAAVNYGTLLAVPAPAIAGSAPEGAPFALADLRGRWAFVIGSAGACEAACARDALRDAAGAHDAGPGAGPRRARPPRRRRRRSRRRTCSRSTPDSSSRGSRRPRWRRCQADPRASTSSIRSAISCSAIPTIPTSSGSPATSARLLRASRIG